jgi:hypothetical protein
MPSMADYAPLLVRWGVALGCLALVHQLSVHFESSEAARTGPLAQFVLFVSVVTTVFFLRKQQRELAEPTRDAGWDGCPPERAAEAQIKYELTVHGGFLPTTCLERLPPAFEAWEALADALPKLNRAGALCAAVDALPVLDAASLVSRAEQRRACWLLAALAHSYMNGWNVCWRLLDEDDTLDVAGAPTQPPAGAGGLRRLPSQLARPWFEVSGALGMPPVLTAAAGDLWNWRTTAATDADAVGMATLPAAGLAAAGLSLLERLDVVSSMTGSDTEQGFY